MIVLKHATDVVNAQLVFDQVENGLARVEKQPTQARLFQCRIRNKDVCRRELSFVGQLGRVVYEFLIAVATFNKPSVMWNHQPNAGVTKRAFGAVTGHFPRGYDFGFWGIGGHVDRSLMAKRIRCFQCTRGTQSVTVAEPVGTAYVVEA